MSFQLFDINQRPSFVKEDLTKTESAEFFVVWTGYQQHVMTKEIEKFNANDSEMCRVMMTPIFNKLTSDQIDSMFDQLKAGFKESDDKVSFLIDDSKLYQMFGKIIESVVENDSE